MKKGADMMWRMAARNRLEPGRLIALPKKVLREEDPNQGLSVGHRG